MPDTTDVAIIGAGVSGCATAYYLAKQGVNVTVVEREAIGSCASGYALGLLNPLFGNGIPGPVQPIAEKGFEMHTALWPDIQSESGVDFQIRLMPHFEVCMTEEEVFENKTEMKRWDKTKGFSAKWVGPGELQAVEPRITGDAKGAVLVKKVGVLDSYRYTLALAQAAEHHGAVFLNRDVTGILSSNCRATGVEWDGGHIDCDIVVVAMGPWSANVSEWLGFGIEVEPLKGQILYLDGLNKPLDYHVHGACSFVQKADGRVWVAATEEHAGFDTSTTTSARDYLMERAISIMPSLGDLQLVNQTACLRPVTPDSGPIIGKAPGWEGVFLATGAEKKGILISPVIGKATADLVTKGSTDLPVEGFSADRFSLKST